MSSQLPACVPECQEEEAGFTLVQRKKERTRPTINIVGDSMTMNTTQDNQVP